MTDPTATLEALLQRLRLRDIFPTSDGARVAFTATASYSNPNAPPQSSVWVIEREAGEARQLQRAPGVAALPRWSPDGRRLAFASDREHLGRMSLYVSGSEMGDGAPLGEAPGSLEDIRWAGDGERLLVLSAGVESVDSGPVALPDESGAPEPDPRVLRPSQSWRRLFLMEGATGRTHEVGPADLNVWEFDWNGEDTIVAVVSDDPSEGGWYTSYLSHIDAGPGVSRMLYAPDWQLACPRLSPDGSRVAFIEGLCSDRGIVVGSVKVIDLESGVVTSPVPQLDVSWLQWRAESTVWYSGWRGMESMCGSVSLDGIVTEIWSGEVALGDPPRLTASADGRWLFAEHQSPCEPPEVAVLGVHEAGQGWRRLTSLNRHLDALEVHTWKRFVWRAPDDLEIEGILVRPRARPRNPLPLVVVVHGGPSACWSYRFPSGFAIAHLLADAGYAVLLPNPRGSTGRGQDFAQAIIGDLGGGELGDILSGMDASVEAGIVDGRRIGIMGASHGGFMAAWAVTQTPRFGASVAMACVSDYLSLHYSSDIGGLDDILFVGEDRIAAYLERSPLVYAHQCTTPTLILHGEMDRCCPVGQAEELYGALVEAGVDTELVVYPREGHGWGEREHQIDSWRRTLGWFDRHLLNGKG